VRAPTWNDRAAGPGVRTTISSAATRVGGKTTTRTACGGSIQRLEELSMIPDERPPASGGGEHPGVDAAPLPVDDRRPARPLFILPDLHGAKLQRAGQTTNILRDFRELPLRARASSGAGPNWKDKRAFAKKEPCTTMLRGARHFLPPTESGCYASTHEDNFGAKLKKRNGGWLSQPPFPRIT
jgi:hypothetical protein